ncbi:hypothetical protein Tco_1037682, partial [Tanacetum coccineum]
KASLVTASDESDPEAAKKPNGRRKPTGVVIKDTPAMSKLKTRVQAQRHKGIDLLSEAALLEEAQMKKAIKKANKKLAFNIKLVAQVMEFKDDHDDHQSDDERTESDDDKIIDLNRINDEEKTQEYEFVHTPDDRGNIITRTASFSVLPLIANPFAVSGMVIAEPESERQHGRHPI